MKLTPHYHDTLDERTRLDDYEQKAETQDARILSIFKEHAHRDFTPAEVWVLTGRDCPITSVRRSITNLEHAGRLIKRGKRAGLYGRDNFAWYYRGEAVQQKLF